MFSKCKKMFGLFICCTFERTASLSPYVCPLFWWLIVVLLTSTYVLRFLFTAASNLNCPFENIEDFL